MKKLNTSIIIMGCTIGLTKLEPIELDVRTFKPNSGVLILLTQQPESIVSVTTGLGTYTYQFKKVSNEK